jgi:hypothetical protein
MIRSQARTYVVMNNVERFVLKRGGAIEPITVQHAIFVKSAVAEVARAAPEVALSPTADQSQPISAAVQGETHACRWTFEIYLQRQICFASISGLIGCAEPVSMLQPEVESGDYEFDPKSPDEPACNDSHPLVATARGRAEQRAREQGKALITTDTRTQVLAGIAKLGLTVETR